MCGIVGYLGTDTKTLDILYNGLKRLEYRGYDSSGICIQSDKGSNTVKSKGKLENLKKKIKKTKLIGNIGIGHTRWATHGKPNESNAHPHKSGSVSIVHNGIIENYIDLKDKLVDKGYKFNSDTDSEVIAHLVEDHYKNTDSLEDACRNAFKQIEGSYAVAILSENEPEKIVATKKFSPLIVAQNNSEKFLASDVPAILPYCNEMIFLEDGDFVVLDSNGIKITDIEGLEVSRKLEIIEWDPVLVERSGYRHYMLKEIYEQPQAVFDTIRGKFNESFSDINFDGLDVNALKFIDNISIVACGTSYHAALIGKHYIESISRMHTSVELASEFRYRNPIVDSKTLVIAVSQSGETADTSEALLEAIAKGALTLGITNVEMSKISREAGNVIYTKAGPEIGVASTKAFTTQIIVFYLLSILLGKLRKSLDKEKTNQLVNDALSVSKLQRIALNLDDEIKELARDFYQYKNFLYLGRGINYPVALEGALKLKEVSYIHAEGYAAGEMKHGPIALIDDQMPVVIIAPSEYVYFKKIQSNFEEIKARGGRVVFITSNSINSGLLGRNDRAIYVPKSSEYLSPLISAIPVQFIAYHIACLLGTDVDQPRNLAKVVTVE